MLKTYSEPSDRRSIVVQKGVEQAKDHQAPEQHISKSQHEEYQSTNNKPASGHGDIALDDMRIIQHKGFHVVEPEAGLLRAQSPRYSLKRTKSRPRLTVPREISKALTLHTQFHMAWRHQRKIGEGGDGVVHLYKQSKKSCTYVAVKLPQGYSAREDMEQEIMNMRKIGRHSHILELRLAVEEWYPYGPAMFLPYCELGSLNAYRESWCEQQVWEGQPARVSEITMYKLFRDMVLALNYLHSELRTHYIHNDFKPANILVVVPPEQRGAQILPEEPVFKLADFARLASWPTPKGELPRGYDGTPEYAPPQYEQIAPVHPSVDIWGLGATLQYMALGIHPIQSREAFVRRRKAQGKSFPRLEDDREWLSEYWRGLVPTFFRPINVSLKVLQTDYDFPWDLPDYQPYGVRLGHWYAKLWHPVGNRPKASQLAAEAIPQMDEMVERLKLQRLKQLQQDEGHGAL